MDLGNMQTHFVTPLGMYNTKKNTSTEDIIIGRQ